MVVTDNGQSSVTDFAGYHDVFTDSAGATVYYAVVPYPNGSVSTQTLSTFQQDTLILSHEVSEAITDPDTKTGWFDAQQGEIGDIAQGTSGILHGYVVQGVWSQAEGQIVVPSDTSTPSLLVTGMQVQATAGQSFTGVVATVTGAGTQAQAADFTATINWGDGSTSDGTITADPKGGFDITGTHTYPNSGQAWPEFAFRRFRTRGDQSSYVITVTVNDTVTNATGTGQGSARVAPLPPNISAHGQPIQATSGQQFSGVVATFTDANAQAQASDFKATIYWGDGTTSDGTITVDPQGRFDVTSTHTYITASGSLEYWSGFGWGFPVRSGNQEFEVTVSISDTLSADRAIAKSLATVAPAPPNLTVTAQKISATVGQQFSGVVATFTDVDPKATAGNFTATINWGDGTTTQGTVTADPKGGFDVSGSHTYSSAAEPADAWENHGFWFGRHGSSFGFGDDGYTLTVTVENTLNGDSATAQTVVSVTPASTSTTTTLDSAPNPSVSGQTVTFTATVAATAPGTGTPTGTVTFLEGSTTLASGVTLNTSDQATFTTSSLAVGGHTITADYSGDTSFSASTGDDSASPQVVNQASTTTTLDSAPNPSVLGQTVTFTATVAATAPGTGPTGTVNFLEGGNTLASGVTLDGSDQATFATSSLAVGSHTITASYSGDTNFLASAGDDSASPQVVNQAFNQRPEPSHPGRRGRRQGDGLTGPRVVRQCHGVAAPHAQLWDAD